MTDAVPTDAPAAEEVAPEAVTPDAVALDAVALDAVAPDARPADATPAHAPAPTFAPKPQRSARLVFTQTVLGLEALAALFAATFVSGLARAGFVDASQGAIWGLGLWLMVMLGYAVGQQKKRWGVWLGSVLQAPLILGYFIDPAIAIIGVMFLALWITALRLGGRIDRERAERIEATQHGDAEHAA